MTGGAEVFIVYTRHECAVAGVVRAASVPSDECRVRPLQWRLHHARLLFVVFSHYVLFRDVMVSLVLLTFFGAIAARETHYIFHLILMSKVR